MKLFAHRTLLLVRLWGHLDQRRKRQFALLLGLMMVSVVAEVISLGAVVPFIGVLAAPDMVFEHRAVADLARAWGIMSTDQLALPLTIAFASAAIISGAIRMLLSWVSTRFTFSTGADLSREVYRRSLYQPYRVHIGRSSSQVISGITSKVGGTMLGVLLPFVTLVSSGLLLMAIMGTLIAIDPKVASIAAFGFGGSYVSISWFARRKLRHNSRRIAYEHTQVVKALQEGLGGIRDVLLDGTQPVYCMSPPMLVY